MFLNLFPIHYGEIPPSFTQRRGFFYLIRYFRRKKLETENSKLKTLCYLCNDNRFKLREFKRTFASSLVTRRGFFI